LLVNDTSALIWNPSTESWIIIGLMLRMDHQNEFKWQQWCFKGSDIGHRPIHSAKCSIDLPPIQSNDRSKLRSSGHCPTEFHLVRSLQRTSIGCPETESKQNRNVRDTWSALYRVLWLDIGSRADQSEESFHD
jgi:hypothetical protein